jgi:hypothetical protein
VLLLLLLNVFSAWAQNISPVTGAPINGTCIPHNEDPALRTSTVFTYSGTGTAPVWSTKGPIEIVPGTPNNASTVTIRSTGYGKGRLFVSFNRGTCTGQQEFIDIYKTFVLPPPNAIIGPKCVEAGQVVTYSINSIMTKDAATQDIGIDSYEWDLPADWTQFDYAAGDRSSITVTMPNVLAGPYTLRVRVGRCNTQWYELPFIGAKMDIPLIATGHTGCLPMHATGTNELTLTVPTGTAPGSYNSANTYTWLLPTNSNWRFKDGYTENSVPTIIIVDNTTNFVRLKVARSGTSNQICDVAQSEPFEIKRKLAPGSVLTTSETDQQLIKITNGTACVDGSKPAVYKVVDASGSLVSGNFTWKFTPDDATNTTFAFSPRVPTGPSVSFNAGTSGGMLTATNGDGSCGDVINLPVRLMPTRPSGITGLACQAPGATNQVYSVTAVTGVTYTWSFTGTLSSPDPTVGVGNSIRVNIGASGGTISVVASNGTCTSAPSVRTVGLAPVQVSAINVTGPCINRATGAGTLADEVTFTVANHVAGQTYSWQVLNAATLAVPPATVWSVKPNTPTNGSSITYVTNGTGGGTANTYQVRVTSANGCGSSTPTTLGGIQILGPGNLTVRTTPTEEDDGNGGIIVTGESLTASLRTYPAPGSTTTTAITDATYEWFINGVKVTDTYPYASIFNLSGNGIQLFGNSPGTVRVVVTKDGCSTSFQTTSNFATGSGARAGSPENTTFSTLATVYPNPSSGEFTLELNTSGEASVVVRDVQGKALYKTRQREKKAKVNVSTLPNGTYILQVTVGRKTVSKKIQIQK